MKGDEARLLLGLPTNSRPSPSQVKAAYRRKVWECHPDLFPAHHQKPLAESNFKLKSKQPLNDYKILTCQTKLFVGGRGEDTSSATYVRVVRTGVARAQRGSRNHTLIQVHFLFLVREQLHLEDLMLPGLTESKKRHTLLTILFFLDNGPLPSG